MNNLLKLMNDVIDTQQSAVFHFRKDAKFAHADDKKSSLRSTEIAIVNKAYSEVVKLRRNLEITSPKKYFLVVFEGGK
jgi:hypothetical protein